MKNLSDLLAKYRQLKPTDSLKKEALQEAIKQYLGIEIEKSHLKITNNVAFLKLSPLTRMEILAHKAEILRTLAEKLPNFPLKDLR